MEAKFFQGTRLNACNKFSLKYTSHLQNTPNFICETWLMSMFSNPESEIRFYTHFGTSKEATY